MSFKFNPITGNLDLVGAPGDITIEGGKFTEGIDPLNAVYMDGDVGINTVLPKAKLDVNGDVIVYGSGKDLAVSLTVNKNIALKDGAAGGAGQNLSLTIGKDRRADGNSSIRLIGETDVEFGSVWHRYPGADAPTFFLHKGTGPFLIQALDAGSIRLTTDSEDRLTVTAGGNIGIGTTIPYPSALLELVSTDKGFLAPRMSEAQRITINEPANSLLVYQTDSTTGFYFYNGTGWKLILDTVDSYEGKTKFAVMVNSTEDGLVFRDPSGFPVKCVEGIGINKGQAFKITGWNTGENAYEIELANQLTDIANGLLNKDMANGDFSDDGGVGLGVIEGTAQSVLDTSNWAVRTLLYVGTQGNLTDVNPAEGSSQSIATVLRSHTSLGTLQVSAQNIKQIASDVRFTPDGNIESTNVQDAISEISFTKLPDTPNNYLNSSGKTLVVNSTEDGMKFADGDMSLLKTYRGTIAAQADVVTIQTDGSTEGDFWVGAAAVPLDPLGTVQIGDFFFTKEDLSPGTPITHITAGIFEKEGALKAIPLNNMLDEDDMTSDSDTDVATQQSVKAYVDTQITVNTLWSRTGTDLSPFNEDDNLVLNGNLTLANGSQTDGYALFSDADGLTSWQPIPDIAIVDDPWLLGESRIAYMGGRVGIGIQFGTIGGLLGVNGNISVTNAIVSRTNNLILRASSGNNVRIEPNAADYGLVVKRYSDDTFGNISINSNGFGFGFETLTSSPHLQIGKTGNIGLGVINPTVKLKAYGSLTFIATENNDNQMQWVSEKGAFRAGVFTGTQLSSVNIGVESFAVNRNTKASGTQAVAFGSISSANGDVSVAFGKFVAANGTNSFVAGRDVQVDGDYSFVIGLRNQNKTIVTASNVMVVVGGNVGLNVIDPQERLEVDGAITCDKIKVGEGTIDYANTTHPPIQSSSQTGLDDVSVSGEYSLAGNAVFQLKIESVGGTDTFEWRKDSLGEYSAPVTLTGTDQLLQDGISVKWDAITGHTLNDTWEIHVGHEISSDLVLHANDGLIVKGDVIVTGNVRSLSAVKLLDGMRFINKESGNSEFHLYVSGTDSSVDPLPTGFDGSLIFKTSVGNNPSQMNAVFWDGINTRPSLVINQGGANKASVFERSLVIGAQKGTKPLDGNYTIVNADYDKLKFNTSGDGADLGVENDLQVLGTIYTKSINVGTALPIKTGSDSASISLGGGGCLVGAKSDVDLDLLQNAYYNDGYRYLTPNADGASRLTLNKGRFTFYTAPTGVMDAEIVFTPQVEIDGESNTTTVHNDLDVAGNVKLSGVTEATDSEMLTVDADGVVHKQAVPGDSNTTRNSRLNYEVTTIIWEYVPYLLQVRFNGVNKKFEYKVGDSRYGVQTTATVNKQGVLTSGFSMSSSENDSGVAIDWTSFSTNATGVSLSDTPSSFTGYLNVDVSSFPNLAMKLEAIYSGGDVAYKAEAF